MVQEKAGRLASKDCRKCQRRRIKCDRQLPFCFKCSLKEVECPGYGPRYQWTNAIAVRGRFKGFQTPNINTTVSDIPNTSNGLKASGSDTTPSSLVFHSNSGTFQQPDGGHDSGQDKEQEKEPARERVFPRFDVLETIPEHVVEDLLHHYASKITPMMVWLDSDMNEYRRLVVPLAEKFPILRLAILAISSAHQPDGFELYPSFSQSAGQSAILMITEWIRKMTTSQDCGRIEWNDQEAEGILASMLILSNHSLLGSNPSQAQSHREAARIVIGTLTLDRVVKDELAVFLKNQLAIYDILACTTVFETRQIENAVVPDVEEQDSSLFGRFLSIVHRITVWSTKAARTELHFCSIVDLEEEFEIARGLTLLAAGSMIKGSNPSTRNDFIRLVQAYYHGGVLYACKRLDFPGDDQIKEYHAARLFEVLTRFENVEDALHNLAWPLFLAGICCFDDQSRMGIVADLCQLLSARTRFEHYVNILDFLRELWHYRDQDWRSIARQWEQRRLPIIAV